MQPVPLFEEERQAPELLPTADLVTAMNIVRKTLLAWRTQKDRTDYGDLVTYIDASVKLSKQIPKA